MQKEAISEYMMVDGELYPVATSTIFEQIDTPPIYEVVRLIDGLPLFLRAHLARFERSAAMIGKNLIRSRHTMVKEMQELAKANGTVNGNIKLLQAEIDGVAHFLVYEMPHHYPEEDDYGRGVRVGIYKYSRAMPNAKVYRYDFRREVAKLLKEKSYFEVLLLGEDGLVPEGSRSNVFYLKDGTLYTSPAVEVLEGVTRMMIIKACQELGIPVVERTLSLDEVQEVEGAFLSGTSIGVLPISRIENRFIPSVYHPIIMQVRSEYEQLKNNDVRDGGWSCGAKQS